jgi:hypothetical protein
LKADSTNIAKMFEDVAKGVFYRDNSQITTTISIKLYGEPPRTQVMMRYREDIKAERYAKIRFKPPGERAKQSRVNQKRERTAKRAARVY